MNFDVGKNETAEQLLYQNKRENAKKTEEQDYSK